MKIALEASGPWAFSAWRYVVGTVIAFVWIAARRRRFAAPPWRATIIIGLCQTTGMQALAEWALLRGGAGKTSLLAYTMPFWTVLFARLWLHERLGVARIASIGIAATGLFLIIEPWHGVGDPLSVGAAIGGGFSWAIGVVVTKRTFESHPRLTPAELAAWQLLAGTLVLVLLALIVPARATLWTPGFTGAVFFTGVLATGLGWIMWSFIVQHLPASVAGLTSLGVPITGVLLSWALLGERPSPIEGLGIVLIATALLGLNFAHTRAAPSNGSS